MNPISTKILALTSIFIKTLFNFVETPVDKSVDKSAFSVDNSAKPVDNLSTGKKVIHRHSGLIHRNAQVIHRLIHRKNGLNLLKFK